MKSLPPLLFLVAATGFFLTAQPGRADTQLSADNLDKLDQWGWLTPGFKTAVHDLVDSKQAIVDVKKEEKELTLKLPDVQKQADDAEAQVKALRAQLADYDHTADSDFAELQKRMNDTGTSPDDQRVLAQAYLWAYPASPHQGDAQQYLQQAQKKVADQVQAAKDAEAARVAARAKLLERAQAHQLSLAEWRDFLRDMSQEDLLKYFGRPDYEGADYWVYSGDWTEDPVSHQKVGLQMAFNAARVISVAEAPH